MTKPDTTSPEPLVSVIIPVFNDTARLQSCLLSLEAQSYPAAAIEIIVVDNDSEDDPSILRQRFPVVKFVHESCPGPYAARNTGEREASGSILAFTDADCRPDADWISKAVELMERTNCEYVGGRTEIIFNDHHKPSPAESFERFWDGRQRHLIEIQRFAPTCNLIVQRRVFEKIGGFDETLYSGSDVEWGRRAVRAGVAQAYAHDSIVRHECRHSMTELMRREARDADGIYQLFFRLEPLRFNYLRGLLYITFLPGWRRISLGRIREKFTTARELAEVLFVNEVLRCVRVYEFFRMSWDGTARRA